LEQEQNEEAICDVLGMRCKRNSARPGKTPEIQTNQLRHATRLGMTKQRAVEIM
jgi:hypothetical protein